jgi:uncharacterized membrane protein YhaH (DUF805 family)
MTTFNSPDLRNLSMLGWPVASVDMIDGLNRARTGVKRALRLVVEMASPRGRCNRQGFLHIALAFLALQTIVAGLFWLFGHEMTREISLALNAPLFWIGTTICIKRLHDTGRRGWWLPAAFIVWLMAAMIVSTVVTMVLPSEAMDDGQPAYLAVIAAITLPAFAALIWLHTASSELHANRFGPVPKGFGLSLPVAVRCSSRQARAYYADAVLA